LGIAKPGGFGVALAGQLVSANEQLHPEQKAVILAEARVRTEQRSLEVSSNPEAPLKIETPLERWKRQADELEQRAASERAENTLTETQAAQWRAELLNMIADTATSEREFARAVLAEVVAHLQNEFEEQIGGLRAEMSIAKAADKQVIDLPNFLTRKRA
jgi:hypothetical protein